jgi:uncharacterized damage-inducible protein DinB
MLLRKIVTKRNNMKLFFSLLFALGAFSVNAQNALGDSLKQQMIQDWERAKSYTDEYLDAMPADKYGFQATDSMRSFAQQMLHLATANAGFAFIGLGAPYPFTSQNFEKLPALQNKDSVVFYVNTSYNSMINALKKVDPETFGQLASFNLPGGKRTATRLAWLMKAFEHQTHHRGQCTVYFRLLNLRPPAEKLF